MNHTLVGVPPGGVVVRADGAVIRPRLFWSGYAWLGVAGCLAIAVLMPLDLARRVSAGKQGVSTGGVVGVAAAFAALAVVTAVLAVRLSRSAWVVDAAGIRKSSWRRARVDWSAVTAVELRRTGRYWQVWVHAPGAVRVAGRRRPADRLVLGCATLAPRPADLHSYLVHNWQNGQNR